MTDDGISPPMKDKEPLAKISAVARRELRQGELRGPVEALLRTEDPPTQDQQQQLLDAGWHTRSATAQVLAGTAEAEQLEAICRLPFVRQVELSRPLYQEPAAAVPEGSETTRSGEEE